MKQNKWTRYFRSRTKSFRTEWPGGRNQKSLWLEVEIFNGSFEKNILAAYMNENSILDHQYT